jgi:hypothetical protein
MANKRSRRMIGLAPCHPATLLYILVGYVLLPYSSAHAVAPPFVSDEELARSPAMVVAKWDKAPLVPHNLVEGNWSKEQEVRTEIVVTRVIKGTLKPGKYTILLGPFIGWERQDGGGVMSYMSTQVLGDVSDVKDENLWFLESRRSWDRTDKVLHPVLDTYRGVQPRALEPYFHALAGPSSDNDVPKLLGSQELIVIERTLQYITGGELPWPDEPWTEWERPESVRKPLVGQSASVQALLKRKEPEVRRLAASVYAALTDRKSIPVMRELLHDDDAHVRGVAVGILSRFRDEPSIATLGKAVTGLEEPTLACKVIALLAQWKDERVVPALITFLENDGFAYQVGDDVGIPALKARNALHDTTGLWFPQDVDASLRAWEKVRTIANRQERETCWKTLVAGVACPLKAELEGDDAVAHIVVTNVSLQVVTVAKFPSQIEERWSSGSADTGTGGEGDDFISLKPGESSRYKVKLHGSFLYGRPGTQRLIVSYWNSGRKQHLKAWIGPLEVKFGPAWKGSAGGRQKSVEKWPNGNLKATGQKHGERKVGRWTYYNEQGDRIREEDFDEGQTSEFNPNHPHNKGLGRPKAKD